MIEDKPLELPPVIGARVMDFCDDFGINYAEGLEYLVSCGMLRASLIFERCGGERVRKEIKNYQTAHLIAPTINRIFETVKQAKQKAFDD